ncbi:SDR family oxidoreductase [Ramlibacter sp. 2FC]|uniref:SDR family oxidoreductase n=1 Tax=Ramlibacter sp. 2FC TaxID=2502188 RepID=UPI0010F587F7|nr:SDR family oxidoreductase [Ramlibacter sp. 2FC]
MDLHLTDKVVLITGGSKGIGLACARAFAAEGARVAIVARQTAPLEAAAVELRRGGASVLALAADLVEAVQAEQLVREVEQALGPVDVLVNAAGAARRTPAQALQAADWHAAMDAKYFTYIHAMQAVLPGMAARRSGAIVNVIGAGGKLASPTHLPGGAANAALMLASAGLANAYAPSGVRVNAVNPGPTLTERLQQGLEAEAAQAGISVDEALARTVQRLPLGRLARPEEIADMVLFLASQRASYVTGAIVAMDGASIPTVL